jgi:uncharacterized repeat protein (TIGR03803 family)
LVRSAEAKVSSQRVACVVAKLLSTNRIRLFDEEVMKTQFTRRYNEDGTCTITEPLPDRKPGLALMLVLWAAALVLPVVSAQGGVVFTSLYSFSGDNDGGGPLGGLVQGSDGYFYGTTVNGGTNSAGTVFKISTSGALTSLYSFSGGNDGANPYAGLVQGSDGNFYGTTQSGGKPTAGGPAGTVFKISPNGALTNLYSFTDSFTGGNDGASPEAGLVLGRDGNFYGTTFQGGTYFFSNSGTNGYGTVFKISTNGVLISLYAFSANDGANPQAGLVPGSDGYFYGTTQSGGMNNAGTVFKLSTNGALTSLYSFSGGNDGANPYAGLVQGSDGNFYGTTQIGGTNGGEGTLFKIGANGSYTSLYSFSGGNDGSNPQVGLVQGSDGNFYGTTYGGGTGGAGTVFRLTVPLGPPHLTTIPAGANVILTWPTNATGFALQSTTNLGSSAVWTANSPAPVVVNGLNTVTNPLSGTQQFFRLSH